MGQYLLPEGAAPSTPAAGYVSVYAKTDGKIYSKDDAGVETVITHDATLYALLAGSSTQTFSVAPATAAAHAARLDQISLMPTVASTATPDIFGAAGATINYTGTTTATGLVSCTAAQVGSKKTIIPVTGASFTASASFVIDGATSGTYLMPAGAVVEVIATSTTTFNVTTNFATGTWTPEYELATPGTSSFGTYAVQTGRYIKVGNKVTAVCFAVAGTFSLGTGSGSLYIKGLPYTCSAGYPGAIAVSQASAYVTNHATHGRIAQSESRALLRTSGGSGATMTNIDAVNCGTAMRTELVAEYFV